MKKSTRITYIWQRVLMAVVFVVGIVGLILNDDESVKSEYLFICAQSAMFLIVSFLPNFLRKFELDIPDFIYIIFIFFCLAHFFCGEILGFFVKIKWWDSLLHTFSGMIIALLSFSLINLLNKNANNFKLSIGFMALFAFSMAIAIGVIWEIIEFSVDSWFGTNMQRAYISTMNGRGAPLFGQEALADTMKDLILDSIGAGVVCIICIIAVCKNKIKVEDLSFIKKKKKVVMMDNEDVVNLEKRMTQPAIENNERVLALETNLKINNESGFEIISNAEDEIKENDENLKDTNEILTESKNLTKKKNQVNSKNKNISKNSGAKSKAKTKTSSKAKNTKKKN